MSNTSPLLSSTTLGNIDPRDSTSEWRKLFQAPVEEDDPIWKDYIAAAAAFDNRMIDQWNKIIDGVLVYVALFISVLTAFVVVAAPQFDRNPVDISNQLLLAIVNHENISQRIEDLSQPDHKEHHKAVVDNALLFGDLALSIVVSMIALFSKLWVINYSHQVNSSGSPYERAMKRQEAYSGVLAWRLGEIIDALPFLLLIAVFVLGIFIYQSIRAEQGTIGYIVGAMLMLGFVFLVVVSVAAAFIPACPFNSSLTALIKIILNLFPGYCLPKGIFPDKHSRTKWWIRRVSVTVISILVTIGMVFGVQKYSGSYYALMCVPFAASISTFAKLPKLDRRPPRFGIQYFILLASIVIAPVLIAAGYYTHTHTSTFLGLFLTGCALIFVFAIAGSYIFKFIPDTQETDAVAWLLNRTSSQEPSYFQKAGQISEHSNHQLKQPEDGSAPAHNLDHRKASLLTSLLPLLSSLITSKIQYRTSQQKGTEDSASQEKGMKDLEIYVACLAQLSAFTKSPGSFLKNESALEHPSLSPPDAESLADSLEKILGTLEGESNSILRSAAEDALRHYSVVEKIEGQESLGSQVMV